MGLPLEGVKVLDLSRLLPGPYASLVLADLGATVDKLEDPEGGDSLRHTPPLVGDESTAFTGLNRNKRSITLNLKSAVGLAALKRLVKHYDVLLESFRPGVMERLGCGFEALAKENPRLVYCSISGYGQTGPDRLRAGHDLNLIARSGLLGYGGVAGGPPAMPGAQVADIGASLFSLVGILAALHERHATGQGRFVDVSMAEGAMAFIHLQLASRLLQGPEGTPLQRGRELLNGGLACYGVYRTADDRYLAVASLEPKFLSGLLEVVGRPDLMAGAWDLGEAGSRTRRELQAAFATRSLAQWAAEFKERDLCVEPVAEGDEVFADEQFEARGLFAVHAGRTWLRTAQLFAPGPISPPPELGGDSREILREAGFSPEDLAALGLP